MIKKKINCWEYMGCGLEPGGKKSAQKGVCPAASDPSFSGINSGINAGRFCWAVAGTHCNSEQQGNFSDKQKQCHDCDFFHMVSAEEGTKNLRTKFLRFVGSPQGEKSILKNMRLKTFRSGERFVFQGKEIGEAYIICKGSCIVLVEKNGNLHPVDHRGEGDIVNMSALFTGEPSMANVEAETEIEAWVIQKSDFENIPENDPDLWAFLTEIVADRFDSKRPTSYRTIGNYLATDIIGRGGYSIVYKGKEISTNQPVAIKMMRHNMVMDSDFLEQLKKEAEIVGRLNHDNIIKVFDMVERYRTVFIVMEYLEGESIMEKIQRDKRIVPHLAINYLIQSCLAIEYAHSKNILHKDINPGNLMVLNNGKVKLVDFGIACSVFEDDELFDGAIPYLAPELIKGEPASLKSEIYALGISAFEMVAGKRPYPEENQSAFTRMRCVQEIPDPQIIIPDIPRNLRQFILKACRIDPEERYQGIGESVRELRYEEDQLSFGTRNIDIVAHTHIGLVKTLNEDRYLVRTMDDNALLLAVTDGLGGNVSSDVAAEITNNRLSGLKYLKPGREAEDLDTFARDLDLIIHKKAKADSGLTYMATTLACVVLKADMIHWLNAGDSRFYILRDDQLLQITQDHTLARVLVEEGRLKPEDADTHYSSKILDQCLGYGMCDPETGSIRVKKNDLIILSTDGMYKMVKEQNILQILKLKTTLGEKIEALMNLALISGGEDDITLVFAHIKEVLT